MRKIVIMAGVLCNLGGCDLPTTPVAAVAPTTYHSVSYYNAHPLERSQTKSWCSDNPGLAEKNPSCDSADTSARQAWHHQMGWE